MHTSAVCVICMLGHFNKELIIYMYMKKLENIIIKEYVGFFSDSLFRLDDSKYNFASLIYKISYAIYT